MGCLVVVVFWLVMFYADVLIWVVDCGLVYLVWVVWCLRFPGWVLSFGLFWVLVICLSVVGS